MRKFSREVMSECANEICLLLENQLSETDVYNGRKLSPNLNAYLAAEQGGSLRCYTIRIDDGSLVGYGTAFVHPSMYFSNQLMATHDIVYLLPEYRGITSYKFMKWIDRQLGSEGVVYATRTMPIIRDFDLLMGKLGYHKTHIAYEKDLGGK